VGSAYRRIRGGSGYRGSSGHVGCLAVVHGTIDLKSSPEGATAQTSLGGDCETPCSMEVSSDRPFTVTFRQRGYAPSTVNIQIQRGQPGVTDPKFTPNPVFVQLAPSRRP